MPAVKIYLFFIPCLIIAGKKERKRKHTRVFEVVSVVVRKGLHLAILVHFTEAKLLGGS